MARLQLDGVEKKMYEDQLKGKDHAGKPATPAAGSDRRRASADPQSSHSDPELDALEATPLQHSESSLDDPATHLTYATARSRFDSDASAEEHGRGEERGGEASATSSASASEGDAGIQQGSGSEDDSSEGTGDSQGAGESSGDEDDLEGLPTASKLAAAKAQRREARKKQPGAHNVITEPGARADKLGLAFERVLAKAAHAGVMEGSASLRKRKREDAEEAAAHKAAVVARRERKRRGHARVLPRGKDAERDAVEKGYARTATKGVVQLFNAITQAQKARRQADAASAKSKDAVRDTKDALLKVLHPDRPQPGTAAEQPGWKVLQDGYTGMEEQKKLKDLDRAAAPVEDIHGELDDVEASDEDYADW